MVTEIMKFKASDGEEFDTRAAAEAHEATLALGSVEREIGFLDLLADPLSPRAQAFEKIGLQIQRARLAHPNGPKRKDKRRQAFGAPPGYPPGDTISLISPAAHIDAEKMGPPQEGVDVYIDIDDVMGSP